MVAEYGIAMARAAGQRAFYTAPIKALSNQKYRDLVAIHGEDAVGLLTGDNAINGDAPIVVMTTEVLRNMIYGRSRATRRPRTGRARRSALPPGHVPGARCGRRSSSTSHSTSGSSACRRRSATSTNWPSGSRPCADPTTRDRRAPTAGRARQRVPRVGSDARPVATAARCSSTVTSTATHCNSTTRPVRGLAETRRWRRSEHGRGRTGRAHRAAWRRSNSSTSDACCRRSSSSSVAPNATQRRRPASTPAWG